MRAFFRNPLVIATLIACLCGLLKVGQPLDHMYWNARFRFGQTQAPQSIVLASVNGANGAGTMSSVDQARLLRALASQAPQQIYFDLPVDVPADSELARAIRELGPKVTVVARSSSIENFSADTVKIPDRSVIGDAKIAYSGWFVNFLSYAQGAPDAVIVGQKVVPSLANELAGRRGEVDGYFIPDFGMDPNTIPVVPARQFLSEKVANGLLTGRSVIVTGKRTGSEAQIGQFGHGRVDPVALDIAGAKAIAANKSMNVGKVPLLAIFLFGVLAARKLRNRRMRWTAYGVTLLALVVGPALAQTFGLYSVPSTALMAAMIFGSMETWSKWRRNVLQTSSSGLPNFKAISELKVPEGYDIVVATIGRYEEFLATLPSSLHGECARQIARRFGVGSNADSIFHGDGGHFAWIEPNLPPDLQTEHFEGMRALFSSPLLVGGHMFDTNVHFGLDRNYQFDTLTRINTALASAHDALRAGRTIEQFEAKRLADAPWELSLLARIDEGMRNGDIWVAYQPQWDYRENRICGAEALVRWNDPDRGPIRPDAFIVQAERAGRIDALTYWVMEEAITAAQIMSALGPDFQMSINLSALLVDKPGLLSAISEIARRRGIDCRRFTIEITETAAVYNRPAAVQNLQQLRAMGFRLAIDDFGTGESSLLYLAELPSDELKIDQHFVSRIISSEREREIVKSTIRLAHALRQSVVAEGIEDRETFELLRKLGCDTGQGYYIGRPGTFEQLRTNYLGVLKRGSAL